MPEDINKLGADDITSPEMLAARLNKQFKKYNELLSGTATKAEIKQLQADLIVETKSILDKVTAEGDVVEGLKKQLTGFAETVKIQGETITKLKTAFNPQEKKETFSTLVHKQLKDGVFEDFINEKNSRAKMQINTKDLAFTGTYGSGAAQHAYMPFQQPAAPDAEDFDVRMIVPTGTIDSEKLDYPQERSASRTDNSDWVTENAETTGSAIGFTMTTVNSERYTDHIKISRRAMRNTSWLAAYMQAALLQAFITKLNAAVIAGAGSSNELDGLLNNANTFVGTGMETKFANADYFSVMRAARAEMLKTYKRTPNNVMLDPLDAAILNDTRTTIGGFLNAQFAGAGAVGYQSILNMKLTEAADITDGGYLLADINPSTVQLLFNGPIEILASDSDDDNFTKNLITLKIEADVMLPIYNTNALLKGTLETDKATIAIS